MLDVGDADCFGRVQVGKVIAGGRLGRRCRIAPAVLWFDIAERLGVNRRRIAVGWWEWRWRYGNNAGQSCLRFHFRYRWCRVDLGHDEYCKTTVITIEDTVPSASRMTICVLSELCASLASDEPRSEPDDIVTIL